MLQQINLHIYLSLFCLLLIQDISAKTGRYRVMWRDDPATTMVIGWDQISGTSPQLYLDTRDYGRQASSYAKSFKAARSVAFKKMNNHFVRLTGLRPSTVYYFVVKDSESTSQVYSFKTAPDQMNERLSIIAGGDSRNHRDARRDANKLVSKLRPHAVMFGGDMTGGDTGEEWKDWFDDWQLTISKDGRIYPIIVARGNHESSNKSLTDLFDVPAENVYYSLSLGGNLLKIFTLNSMIAPGGSQKEWLQKDLAASGKFRWKFAQYHVSTLPHTSRKAEKKDQLINWSTLFYKYGVNLVCESDAHVVKSTYPIRPFRGIGSSEGFIRDDFRGTVYVGEGCWGAPLRQADDDKPWTRAMGSFNQFKWIFVSREGVEVRTVMTDGADNVSSVDPDNIFRAPYGLILWTPDSGEVINIRHPRDLEPPSDTPDRGGKVLAARGMVNINNFAASRSGADVNIRWETDGEIKGMSFKVQRSIAGKNFVTIAEVIGKGTPQSRYLFTDKQFASKNPGVYVNYRIIRVFPDGKTAVFTPKNR